MSRDFCAFCYFGIYRPLLQRAASSNAVSVVEIYCTSSIDNCKVNLKFKHQFFFCIIVKVDLRQADKGNRTARNI